MAAGESIAPIGVAIPPPLDDIIQEEQIQQAKYGNIFEPKQRVGYTINKSHNMTVRSKVPSTQSKPPHNFQYDQPVASRGGKNTIMEQFQRRQQQRMINTGKNAVNNNNNSDQTSGLDSQSISSNNSDRQPQKMRRLHKLDY